MGCVKEETGFHSGFQADEEIRLIIYSSGVQESEMGLLMPIDQLDLGLAYC